MNVIKTNVLLIVATLFFNVSWAQENNFPDEPMGSVDIAALYMPGIIITSAEQMPEENYAFRPTPEVRSFGELIAHIAKSTFLMTALAKGEVSPMLEVPDTKKEALDALIKSFDYYTEARENMTQERKATMVKFMGNEQLAGNVLDFSLFHSFQHYGNIIVYMRLKGLVPPTSQSGSPGSQSQK